MSQPFTGASRNAIVTPAITERKPSDDVAEPDDPLTDEIVVRTQAAAEDHDRFAEIIAVLTEFVATTGHPAKLSHEINIEVDKNGELVISDVCTIRRHRYVIYPVSEPRPLGVRCTAERRRKS